MASETLLQQATPVLNCRCWLQDAATQHSLRSVSTISAHSLCLITTRALQPVATCRQSPSSGRYRQRLSSYCHCDVILIMTSFSLWRHSLLSWRYGRTYERTDTLPRLTYKDVTCTAVVKHIEYAESVCTECTAVHCGAMWHPVCTNVNTSWPACVYVCMRVDVYTVYCWISKAQIFKRLQLFSKYMLTVRDRNAKVVHLWSKWISWAFLGKCRITRDRVIRLWNKKSAAAERPRNAS